MKIVKAAVLGASILALSATGVLANFDDGEMVIQLSHIPNTAEHPKGMESQWQVVTDRSDTATRGLQIIIDNVPMSVEEAKANGVDVTQLRSKGIIIVNGKPTSLEDAASKGIVIVNSKPAQR